MVLAMTRYLASALEWHIVDWRLEDIARISKICPIGIRVDQQVRRRGRQDEGASDMKEHLLEPHRKCQAL
jgi:hypothetical protein